MAKKPDMQETLRRAIVNAGISRYRLSALSGVSQAAISLFVNRRRPTMTLDTAAKLAAVLGLELRPIKPGKGR